MRSDEETCRGTLQVRTVDGELHSRRPGPSWLASPTQRITLASCDPWGLRRATLTAAGWIRLAELTDVDQSRIATISPDFQPWSAAPSVVEESKREKLQEKKA